MRFLRTEVREDSARQDGTTFVFIVAAMMTANVWTFAPDLAAPLSPVTGVSRQVWPRLGLEIF